MAKAKGINKDGTPRKPGSGTSDASRANLDLNTKVGPGAPTKLTPELQAEFCRILAIGTHPDDAAAVLGIHEDTLAAWMQRADQGFEPYVSFKRAAVAAQAGIRIWHLENIRAIADGTKKGNFFASAWYLERTQQHRYALVQRSFTQTETRVSVRDALPAVDQIVVTGLTNHVKRDPIDVESVQKQIDAPEPEKTA